MRASTLAAILAMTAIPPSPLLDGPRRLAPLDLGPCLTCRRSVLVVGSEEETYCVPNAGDAHPYCETCLPKAREAYHAEQDRTRAKLERAEDRRLRRSRRGPGFSEVIR